MNPQQQQAVLTFALCAAFADGNKHDREREQIRRIAESLSGEHGAPDLPRLVQDVLLKKTTLADASAVLTNSAQRQLAYEIGGLCMVQKASSPVLEELAVDCIHLAELVEALHGRAYARVQLAATAHGVSMQPLAQALQEYPEQAGTYADIHRLLDAPVPSQTVQMWARVGFASMVEPAPRWGVDAHIAVIGAWEVTPPPRLSPRLQTPHPTVC